MKNPGRKAEPTLGERIESIRKARGLTRAQLAKSLGWSEIRLWRLERGQTKALADDVRELSAELEVSIAALYGEEAA